MISSIMVKRKGKPIGIDIKEKMTLPLIHVLNQLVDQKKFIINTIKIEIKKN